MSTYSDFAWWYSNPVSAATGTSAALSIGISSQTTL